MNAALQWVKKHKVLAVISTIVIFGIIGLRVRSKISNSDYLSAPIKKGSIIESVYGIGTVTATRVFPLKSGDTNTVRKIYVKEGDQVKESDRLIDLEGVSFRAPFAGTITFLPVKVRETVFPQSVLLNLVDLLDRYITVSLEQRGALRVRQGQKAKINFDSMRDQSFDGVVQSIYSNESNFFVRIGVTDLPQQILPGMTGDVAIGINEHKDVLLVPVAAIDDGKVFVKHGRSRDIAEVKPGIIDGAMAEVVSADLQEGDQLFIRKKMTP